MQNSTYDKGLDIYLRIIDEPVFWLVLAVVGFALSAVIAVANLIVIATIYRDPQKSLRTPPCLLIANLGSSDFLVGLCVVSLVAFRDVYRSLQQQVPLPLSVGIFVAYVLCTTLLICRQCHNDSVVTDLFRRHQQSHAIQNEDHKEKSMHIYYRDMGGISLNMFSSCDKGT